MEVHDRGVFLPKQLCNQATCSVVFYVTTDACGTRTRLRASRRPDSVVISV